MKYFCGTGAGATGTNPVKVHYGLSRRTIQEICSTRDSDSRPTPRVTFEFFFFFGNLFLSITFF